MPKSKICLPDINVWIALSSDLHVHHGVAKSWFLSMPPRSVAFCRVTQMGFLRLISNPKVMAGDAVTQRQAWTIYEELLRDQRVFFSPEHSELEPNWKRYSLFLLSGIPSWTDAYLAGFAKARSWQLVSFDRGFRRLQSDEIQVLLLS